MRVPIGVTLSLGLSSGYGNSSRLLLFFALNGIPIQGASSVAVILRSAVHGGLVAELVAWSEACLPRRS